MALSVNYGVCNDKVNTQHNNAEIASISKQALFHTPSNVIQSAVFLFRKMSPNIKRSCAELHSFFFSAYQVVDVRIMFWRCLLFSFNA